MWHESDSDIHEVLVRVTHVGINFMDIHTRQGMYQASRTYPVRLPCTLGMEGAGTIAAVGDAVGVLRIEMAGRYGFDEVEAAHEALESRRMLDAARRRRSGGWLNMQRLPQPP